MPVGCVNLLQQITLGSVYSCAPAWKRVQVEKLYPDQGFVANGATWYAALASVDAAMPIAAGAAALQVRRRCKEMQGRLTRIRQPLPAYAGVRFAARRRRDLKS